MADQNARKGGSSKGSGDSSDKETLGVKGEALRFFKDLLTEDFTDGIVELSADVELRDRAESFGEKVADAGWAVPAVRKKLSLVPNFLLRIGAPVFGTMIVRDMLGRADRVTEWGREFAQGFARRVSELKASSSVTSPASDKEAEKPKAPAGPPEMSAAEVLAKRPALQQRVDRLPPELRARVYASLNFEHEADALSVPSGSTPFDALIGVSPHYTRAVQVVELAPIEERPGLYALLGARIGSVTQLNDVLMPPPAAAATFEPLAGVFGELTRLYSNQVALDAIVVRLRPHLSYPDRMAFLFPTLVDAGLPAAVAQSAAWSQFTRTVAALASGEAPTLIAEAESRITTIAQLQGFIAPSVGMAPLTTAQLKQWILTLPKRVAALTAQMLEQHLATLEAMTATTPASVLPDWSLLKLRLLQLSERPINIPDEIIAQRLVLIEDARADRHTNSVVKDTMKVVQATTRKLFGDEAHLVQNVQMTTAAVDNLRDRLFGPRSQPGQGVWSFIRSLFARIRAAGAAALAAYRASRAANTAPALPPPNNPPNP